MVRPGHWVRWSLLGGGGSEPPWLLATTFTNIILTSQYCIGGCKRRVECSLGIHRVFFFFPSSLVMFRAGSWMTNSESRPSGQRRCGIVPAAPQLRRHIWPQRHQCDFFFLFHSSPCLLDFPKALHLGARLVGGIWWLRWGGGEVGGASFVSGLLKLGILRFTDSQSVRHKRDVRPEGTKVTKQPHKVKRAV